MRVTLCSPDIYFGPYTAHFNRPLRERLLGIVMGVDHYGSRFKHQSYLWVDGGDGGYRRQRFGFRDSVWSLIAMFQRSWD